MTYEEIAEEFIYKLITLPDILSDVGDRLSAEMFPTRTTRLLFEAVKHLHNSGTRADIVTVSSVLEQSMSVAEVKQVTSGYWDAGGLGSTGLGIRSTFKYLEDGWRLIQAQRKVERVLSDLKSTPIGDVEGSIGDAVRDLRFLEESHKSSAKYGSAAHYAAAWVHDLKARAEAGGQLPGVTTGYSNLDDAIGGWTPGNNYVLLAETGVGKTAVGFALAVAAAEKGSGVLGCSIEMGPSEIVGRMVANLGQVYASTFIRPVVRQGEGPDRPNDDRVFLNVDKTLTGVRRLTAIGENLMLSDESSLTVADVRTMVREINRARATADRVAASKATKEKPAPPPLGRLSLLIIDYLQLIEGDGGKNREQEVAKISKDFKHLARAEGLAILELSQVNEHGRARESKQIENDATTIMHLEHVDPDAAEQASASGMDVEVQLRFKKNRHNAKAKPRFCFQKRFQRFVEIDQ